MTAYASGQLTIHNTDWLEEYSSKISTVIQKHGGKVIARSTPVRLEGSSDVANVGIIIEFPDTEQANNWYQDPDNQTLVNLRNTGSDFELILIEGV